MIDIMLGHTKNRETSTPAGTVSAARKAKKDSLLRLFVAHRSWLIPISILVFLAIWEIIVRLGNFPAFILPSPQQVVVRFWRATTEGSLLRHTGITLFEVLMGLLAGSTLATVLGYLLAKFPIMEKLLSPYLVASQAIPLVAIAPLLVIWFGPGISSKILICALIVFFPVLVNTIVGLRAVPQNLRDLMRSMKATLHSDAALSGDPGSASRSFSVVCASEPPYLSLAR